MIIEDKVILLVEDNPSDVKLTQVALKQSNLANKLVVARDGVEALDYLFGTGAYSGRNAARLPAVTLLDLKMPRLDGLEVLREWIGRKPALLSILEATGFERKWDGSVYLFEKTDSL